MDAQEGLEGKTVRQGKGIERKQWMEEELKGGDIMKRIGRKGRERETR